MNVSNKTYHIKENPYFATGERIIADFVSANHEFNELSIGEYEGDTEIWYIDRDDSSASVLAYANGQWEIEYRYITFGNNVDLSNSSYQVLTWAYDEYIEPKRLRIIYSGQTKLAKINGMLKGSFACEQGVFPFDNRSKWPTPEISLDGSTLSTEIVEGVTQYKVYSNGSYIGYIDNGNVWHGEVSE